MDDKKVKKEIVDLLVENEKAMQELYAAYARKFEFLRDFWKEISEDEESHAMWIKNIYEKIESGAVEFSGDRFPVFAIKQNVEYLKKEIARAEKEEVSLVEALEISVHNENGMLEKKFFEIFKGDSLDLQILLEALKLGTEKHFQEVKQLWEKEKGGGDFEKMKI